ncbi:MAG: prepilin-type N-terminal cleavage/methylation domain-containing protein [Synergistaceae bacterium]|jgi:prepilin-type N-terminal cleavage/methylation domain-containing protein|nr:prepilin-type N-terminal cleavage/methylation domain-containing protein [Synergistaceae bacterium]
MTRRKGFSLIEILLVIIIMAVLLGIVLLNFSSEETLDAQTEARQLVRSLQSVRSAWLAYYADRQVMLGVPPEDPGNTSYSANSPLVRSLEIYASRESLRDDVNKYGGSLVVEPVRRDGGAYSKNPVAVYIGFTGPWNINARNESVETSVRRLLKDSAGDFGLLGSGPNYLAYDGPDVKNQTVLIRVK